ncbi:Dioxygenase [Balamuthia mandrillaris]
MESEALPAASTGAKERARTRLLSYYHQLFPELIAPPQADAENNHRFFCCHREGERGEPLLLSPSAVSSSKEERRQREEAFRLKAEELQSGWDSQPEEFDYELEVEGELPAELRGTLYRNGPGLLEVYGTPLVHPIDADGMICALRFDGKGHVHFRSRFVQTSAFLLEQKHKRCLFHGMMGTKPPATSGGQKKIRYKNPANTNVYFWGGKLLACWESGLPYRLHPETLETIGKETLSGALDEARCLAAHFRVDRKRDLLVSFSLQMDPKMAGKSTVYLHEFDREWNLVQQQAHQFDHFYYCHDLLLTENYYILHQTPFYQLSKANTVKLYLGLSSPGDLVHWYPSMPSRMILVPRRPSAQQLARPDKGIRFFDTEPCIIYHHLNAFEHPPSPSSPHRKQISFASCCGGTKFNMKWDHKYWLSNSSVAPSRVYNYLIDFDEAGAEGSIQRWQSDPSSCEFPTVHPGLNGEPFRFAYLMAADAPHPNIPYQELVKFDRFHVSTPSSSSSASSASSSRRQVWSAREEFGLLGEPVFVPRREVPADAVLGEEDYEQLEDDGWVITQLFNCREHSTQFVVLDAKNIEAGPIARIKLKHHTPYGFHGTFSHEVY